MTKEIEKKAEKALVEAATEKQMAFIDKFVAAGRDKPRPDISKDKRSASEYISQQLKVGPLPKEEAGPAPATKNQVKLVEKLVAEDKKPEPPQGWKEDKKATSEYLDKHAPKQPATEKQMAFIDKLVKEKGTEKPDPDIKKDKFAASQFIKKEIDRIKEETPKEKQHLKATGPDKAPDQSTTKEAPGPANEIQLKIVASMVKSGRDKPDPGWEKNRAVAAKYIRNQLKAGAPSKPEVTTGATAKAAGPEPDEEPSPRKRMAP